MDQNVKLNMNWQIFVHTDCDRSHQWQVFHYHLVSDSLFVVSDHVLHGAF